MDNDDGRPARAACAARGKADWAMHSRNKWYVASKVHNPKAAVARGTAPQCGRGAAQTAPTSSNKPDIYWALDSKSELAPK